MNLHDHEGELEDGEGFLQKRGAIFGKKCAKCGSRFSRLGVAGNWVGVLFCLIFFGGTSKYCSSCRSQMAAKGEKTDKGFLFRLIWFCVVCAIIYFSMKFGVKTA